MPRKASISPFSRCALALNGEYECQHDWPQDGYLQCGDRGVVFTPKGSYNTAFFEAFVLDSFLRGEGSTLQEAEDAAWKKYQRYVNCPGHEFERGRYKNGSGVCKHCKFFKSKVFEPSEKCVKCGGATYFHCGNKGDWFCEKHAHLSADYLKMKKEIEKDPVRALADFLNTHNQSE